MVIEWLAFWGVAEATAFVFKPILEDLAKDAAKGVAGDYIKSCFKSVFSESSAKPLAKATGQAVKELLEQIQEELLDHDVDKAELRDWIPDVKQFLQQDSVKEALGDAFASTDPRLDPGRFAQGWLAITSRHKLPDDFSWERVVKRVSRKIKEIRDHSSELREVFESQALGEIVTVIRQIPGLPPGFDIEVYRSAVMERYGNLNFESLDTTGAYYSGVKLWSVFVPQSVRECQEYYPQVLELPKEHLKRLREGSELAPDDSPGEEAEERRRSYLEQPVRPVLEVVDDDRLPGLVILGDPGAGKSSLLRFLALRWARITDPNEFSTRPL
ncbi:MAG: HEAT repeat domain-containing protein, partial [Isosphaeraceae bacterium]